MALLLVPREFDHHAHAQLNVPCGFDHHEHAQLNFAREFGHHGHAQFNCQNSEGSLTEHGRGGQIRGGTLN